jgi:hypothetical protein
MPAKRGEGVCAEGYHHKIMPRTVCVKTGGRKGQGKGRETGRKGMGKNGGACKYGKNKKGYCRTKAAWKVKHAAVVKQHESATKIQGLARGFISRRREAAARTAFTTARKAAKKARKAAARAARVA